MVAHTFNRRGRQTSEFKTSLDSQGYTQTYLGRGWGSGQEDKVTRSTYQDTQNRH